MLARLEEFTPEEMGAAIDDLGIKAPETKNDLTAPYPFNLMFPTQIGPSGQQRGFMRRDRAGHLRELPRPAVLQRRQAALRGCADRPVLPQRDRAAPALLRVREFTQAEIEHFVHPDHKEHPQLRGGQGRGAQLFSARSAAGDGEAAVSDVGGRRRRQGRHRQRDAGVTSSRARKSFCSRSASTPRVCGSASTCSTRWRTTRRTAGTPRSSPRTGGWSASASPTAARLTSRRTREERHVELTAHERFAEPVMEEVLVVEPNKKDMGKAFKKDVKAVTDALAALSAEDALALDAKVADGVRRRSRPPPARWSFCPAWCGSPWRPRRCRGATSRPP